MTLTSREFTEGFHQFHDSLLTINVMLQSKREIPLEELKELQKLCEDKAQLYKLTEYEHMDINDITNEQLPEELTDCREFYIDIFGQRVSFWNQNRCQYKCAINMGGIVHARFHAQFHAQFHEFLNN